MSELISRSYIKKELNKIKQVRDFERDYDGIIFNILNKAPTVDLFRDVEYKSDGSVVYRFRPTGKWIRKSDEICYWYECEFCGSRPPRNYLGEETFSDYCPNCGACLQEEDIV